MLGMCAKNLLPKRQSKPDCSQFYSVVFHWVAEAFHKRQPDLLKKGKIFFYLI